MQAIQTRYLPATNTKPARIKATCSRGSVTLSWSEAESMIDRSIHHEVMTDEQAAHRAVADNLCCRFAEQDWKTRGEPLNGNPWLFPKASGCLPDGSWAHVFTA